MVYLRYLYVLTPNITARPWGLPGLATSVRASQDDDDDDDEEQDEDEDEDEDDEYDDDDDGDDDDDEWYLLEPL